MKSILSCSCKVCLKRFQWQRNREKLRCSLYDRSPRVHINFMKPTFRWRIDLYSTVSSETKFLCLHLLFLPPANEVCEGYVFTGVCLSMGGPCVVARGGMHSCFGGVHGFFRGAGMRGFFQGACMVFLGGMHGFFWGAGVVFSGGACIGYDEIRSVSGRYASYWNAFLSWGIVS